jgi:hypothetical protein
MWGNRMVRVNLLSMVMIWLNCTFGYYLVNFYIKYVPGNVFSL